MKRKTNLVYRITSIDTDRTYVGQTTGTFKERLRCHLYCAKKRLFTTDFYIDLHCYGIDNFIYQILEYDIPPSKLRDREIFWSYQWNAYHPIGYSYDLHNGKYDNGLYCLETGDIFMDCRQAKEWCGAKKYLALQTEIPYDKGFIPGTNIHPTFYYLDPKKNKENNISLYVSMPFPAHPLR